MKYSTLGAILAVVLFVFYSGCGNSNNFGQGSPSGSNSPGEMLTFRVEVPNNVPGARLVASSDQQKGVSALLRLFSRAAYAQAILTLPGATVTAYDQDDVERGQSTVGANGLAVFNSLPEGTYRFVVTTSDPAVVLQTIASTNETDVRSIDLTTTAATLVVLETTNGVFENIDFKAVEATVRSGDNAAANALVTQIGINLASGTAWLSSNGSTVTSAATTSVVQTAAAQVPVPRIGNQPLAVDDYYSLGTSISVGNGGPTNNGTLTMNVAQGVLANDIARGATVTSFSSTTAAGNRVAVNADGSFTLTVVNSGVVSDQFVYTISNSSGSSQATVQLFVDRGPYGRRSGLVDGPYSGPYGGPYGSGNPLSFGTVTLNVTSVFPSEAEYLHLSFRDSGGGPLGNHDLAIGSPLTAEFVPTTAATLDITAVDSSFVPLVGISGISVSVLANQTTTIAVSQTPTPVTLEAISFAISPLSIPIGESNSVLAIGHYSNGFFYSIDSVATIESGNSAIVSTPGSGVIFGEGLGTTLVTVAFNGISATLTVEVVSPSPSPTGSPQP